MSCLIGQTLEGRVVRSGNKYVVVFCNAALGELGDLFFKLACQEVKTAPPGGYKLVPPLSWSAFDALRRHGGLHVTLRQKPSAALCQKVLRFTVTAVETWLEPQPYTSAIGGQQTAGFVVLRVAPSDADLPCDPPCHISVAQFVKMR